MSQKITLSVPDYLHEKIKLWKDSFNLSKMFLEAVADAIQKKEDFQKRFQKDFNMQDIINRLKDEKLLSEKNYFKIGKDEGLKWVKCAHYDELLHILKIKKPYQLVSDILIAPYFDKIYETVHLGKFAIVENNEHEQMFLEGWLKSVKEFWEHIKEEL